jgi:predicted transcriptional regulator
MQEYLDAYDEGAARAMVFYGLTPEGYRALSENVADIQRYITQSNALLLYYRENLIEVIVEQVEVPVKEEDSEPEEE